MANAFDSAEIIIDSHWGYDPSAIAAVDPATPGSIKTVTFQRVGDQVYVDASAADATATDHLPAYDYELTSCPLILMTPQSAADSRGVAGWEWNEPTALSSFSIFMGVEVSSIDDTLSAAYNFALGNGLYFEIETDASSMHLITIDDGVVTQHDGSALYSGSMGIAAAFDGDASTLQCSVNGSIIVDATGVALDASSMGYLGFNGEGANSRVRLQSLYPAAYNSVSLNTASLSIQTNMLP